VAASCRQSRPPPGRPPEQVTVTMPQKWLGHAQLSTTAVYANAVGAEEKDIARRMWG
jgi:integrase